MKDNKIIIIGLCLVVTIIYLSDLFNDKSIDQPPYIEETKRLRQINDSLKTVNQELDAELELLKDQSDSLLALVKEDRQEIKHLKQQENESIKAIDNYNNDKLLWFFSNLETDSTAY